MARSRLLLAAAAVLPLAACDAQWQRYVPPAAHYLSEEPLPDSALAPSPAADSDTEKRDLAALRDWQAKRTEPECARASSEAQAGYDAFFASLSPFAKPLPREAAEFFSHVQDDTFHVVDRFKMRYDRPRPYVEEHALRPCVPAPRFDGYAYPSGHAALSRVWALVLSDLVPERRSQFMARADQVALDRVIGGVHHPSDIEAGKLLGDEIYSALRKTPGFQNDLKRIRRLLNP